MKLSICTFLKNEGTTIRRMLDSLLGFVDEWVVGVDVSTTDNTREVVEQFFKDHPELAHNVYDFVWQDSFCKARNEGMDKATGDYILVMDGHEYFPETWFNITSNQEIRVKETMPLVLREIEKDKPDEVHFSLYQQPFIGQTPNNFFLQPRIYRNDPKIRFNRAAHNTIVGTNPDKAIHFPEVILLHDAPDENRAERQIQRIAMNTKALSEDLKKNPKDTRALFYLGNTLMEARKWKKAVQQFDKYLKYRTDEQNEKYQVLLHKALCHKELDDWKTERDTLYRAIAINPLRRDAYLLLADIHVLQENWELAEFNLITALKINPGVSRMFQSGPAQTWDPHQRLAYVYSKAGQIEKATAHLQAAYNYLQNPVWLQQIRDWTNDKINILVVDAFGSFTGPFVEYLRSNPAYNVQFLPRFDARIGGWAHVIWCEWADENAILACAAAPQKVVIRAHGYEAYLNGRVCSRIPWDKVKKVVFVAEHIRRMMVADWGIPENKTVVIPNGVDTDKFSIKNKIRDPRDIGYAGFINGKKNPDLLLRIIKANPEFTFHLRAEHQDPFWKAVFDRELKDAKNVVWHPRYDNLADFWNLMSGVLSTSIIESFSYNVAEGMACGCKPYIADWEGARDIWPQEHVFTDMPEFSKDIKDEEREGFRRYVVTRYPLRKSLLAMESALLGDLLKAEEKAA